MFTSCLAETTQGSCTVRFPKGSLSDLGGRPQIENRALRREEPRYKDMCWPLSVPKVGLVDGPSHARRNWGFDPFLQLRRKRGSALMDQRRASQVLSRRVLQLASKCWP